MLGEEGGVAGGFPKGVRDDDTGVGPSGGVDGATVAEGVGRVAGVVAFGCHGVFEFPKPFFEEGGDVGVIGGGGGVDLGITGPAHALVTLRAIGGEIDPVAALGPHGVLENLGDDGI